MGLGGEAGRQIPDGNDLSPGAGEVTMVDLDPQTGVSFRQVAIN